MRSERTRWVGHAARLVRFLAVVLALAAQISSGARALPDSDAASLLRALDQATIFCQSGHTKQPDAPPPRHDAGDQAITQANLRAAQPAMVGIAPLLPSPNTGHLVRAAELPQARAPPWRASEAPYPRGPPSLV
jgi:hypothetical protein